MTYNLPIVSVPEEPEAVPSGLQGLGGTKYLGSQRVLEAMKLPGVMTKHRHICYHLKHRYVSPWEGTAYRYTHQHNPNPLACR